MICDIDIKNKQTRKKKNKAGNHDIYIYRSNFANCKPCKHCTALIKKIGFRRVIYCDNGVVVKAKPNTLESGHVCKIRKVMPRHLR
jgi:hypothetical protein